MMLAVDCSAAARRNVPLSGLSIVLGKYFMPAVSSFGMQTAMALQREGYVMVTDDFVPAALRAQLLAQLGGALDTASKGTKELMMPIAIPASMHARILSCLQTGSADVSSIEAGHQEVGKATAAVDVPARISSVGVLLHQDRHGKGGGLVEGRVAVVYLAGSGTMTFVNKHSQEVHCVEDVLPGRLFVWDNQMVLHKVDMGDTAEPRVMIGPLSMSVHSAADPTAPLPGLVQVGVGYEVSCGYNCKFHESTTCIHTKFMCDYCICLYCIFICITTTYKLLYIY
jgi:hypothetical protein